MQRKLEAPDCRWDLIACDQVHKMSATFFGREIKYTKHYRLGQLFSTLTRHFLLMSATPHNGKEEDSQLFVALLDGYHFEGRIRDGFHVTDVSDLRRQMASSAEAIYQSLCWRCEHIESRLLEMELLYRVVFTAACTCSTLPDAQPEAEPGSAKTNLINW